MAEYTSNKTIAKNTIFLYFRSFLMMAINLFSSRVILQALGVEDYGLYGALGSIVAMFTMINGVLAAGTSRFLTFELGKGDKERLRKTFSASFAMHVALAVILFLLLETVGLWFVNNKMNIPEGREYAANIVYQFSIITSMLTLTQVPYSASIISHEKMSVYAYVGIAEATFKLGLIFVLLYIPFSDNLIAYAIIIAVWSIGLQLWYRFYCRKRFEECNLTIVRDKSIYKGMLSYSLWDFVGQFCSQGINQGLNLLINIFFGVTMNAARSIAFQVENAITQFSSNFMTASQPQIVKSYAVGDFKRFEFLISQGGAFAFYLLYTITLPLFLKTDFILGIWLTEVPEHTVVFLRVIMMTSLFRVIARPLIQGVHATGNVKFLNMSAGLLSALTYLPLVYIFFKVGLPYWSMFVVQIICCIMSSILEAWSLRRLFAFSIMQYIKTAYCKTYAVAIIGAIIPVSFSILLDDTFLFNVLVMVVSLLSASICIFYLGLSQKMRLSIKNKIFNKIKKI